MPRLLLVKGILNIVEETYGALRFEAALFLTTVEAKSHAAGLKLSSGEPAL
jgi:hypothetical protein